MTGIIYKIVDKRDRENILYIGSTAESLASRWKKHKYTVKHPEKRNSGTKLAIYLREQGFDNFAIISIIEFPCEDRDNLNKGEEVFRKYIKPPLNTIRCHIEKKRILCECGRLIAKSSIIRHREAKIHKKRLSLAFLKANLARSVFLNRNHSVPRGVNRNGRCGVCAYIYGCIVAKPLWLPLIRTCGLAIILFISKTERIHHIL